MSPRIYRHDGPSPFVPIPQLDLLTLLFASEHSVSATSEVDIPLHVDTTDPTNLLTTSQLITTFSRIAAGLRTHYAIGANGPGQDVVTVISYGQILVPAAFYGVIAAGGVYSAASPHSTVSELARQISIGKSKWVVCGREFVDVATKAARECGLPVGNVLVLESERGGWGLRALEGGVDLLQGKEGLEWERICDERRLKESLIVILWSSGTTGLPKGVMLSHANLVAESFLTALSGRAWAQKEVEMGKELTPYRTLGHLPISHIAGLFGYLIGATYSGGTVFWMKRYRWEEMIENVKRFEVTAFYTVPSIYLRISKSPEVKDHFKTVENAVTGAAPMDEQLQRAANSRLGYGQEAQGLGKELTTIGQTWGLSETTGAVTAQPKGNVDETGCIGLILPNVELRQVDDDFKDVTPGEPGELLVRSVLCTNGYFNNLQATKDSFTELPDDDGGKWFLTGDIAVLRNGKFYIVDRKKELLKYKGLQVAPAEIENLLFSHPQIAEAAVVGLPGVDTESGSDLPRAYVVRRAGADAISEDEVKEFVRSKLAHYKQLRGGVVFVDELPKNAIGKYLRRDLRERAKKEVGAQRQARL